MMDKTININLAGTLFRIDDVAYRILKDYLLAINNRLKNVQGGHETIEDIEIRIAEIFQSQKGLAGVITQENIEAMISIIGKPEDFDPGEDEANPTVNTNTRKRMYRNTDDSIISGVCGGLGAYLNTDPVLFRILFVLFTCFFGTGILIYIVLWIALPLANSETRKREMYGTAYYSARSQKRQPDGSYGTGSAIYPAEYNNTSRGGNVINEIFRAIGKVFFMFFRIIMIFIGGLLVLTGFISALAFILLLFFDYPVMVSMGSVNTNLSFLSDFLNYIVNPAITPWIIGLTFLVIVLPLFALIYWGIKMIFWFRAKDGILSLILLVTWVLSLASLVLILVNEGVSFSETGRASAELIPQNKPDTLYIMPLKKINDFPFRKDFSLDEDYSVFLVDSIDNLFIRAGLQLNLSEDNQMKVKIRKRSSGKSKIDAVSKAESLIYDCRISNDTLYLDEYFTIPSNSKWAGDNVSVSLFIPENTVLYFDNSAEKMVDHNFWIGNLPETVDEDYSLPEPSALGNTFWIISKEGLKEALQNTTKGK